MVDQLPALPQSRLELSEVALDSFFALRHGAEQGALILLRARNRGYYVRPTRNSYVRHVIGT